ncbi:MAG: FMN-binding negative transcriptional regulator [Pseudomonadota bacterium]
MYRPSHFEEQDLQRIVDLIMTAPLATLVVNTFEGLVANHIPFVLSGNDLASSTLQAHIPRGNPLAELLAEAPPCLAIFHGPEGYVSPSYYASKLKHGRVVPTWNYAVVHVHGHAALIDDAGWLGEQMERLTALNEEQRDKPWKVSDAPAEYTERLLGALVGIELTIDRIEAKTKASQNQPEENQRSVLAHMDREYPQAGLTQLMHAVLNDHGSDAE